MPTEFSPDSAARLASVPAAVRHVHLIGVAGTAMAALAGMLAQRDAELAARYGLA